MEKTMIGRLEIISSNVLEFCLVHVKKIPSKSEYPSGEFQNHADQKNVKKIFF